MTSKDSVQDEQLSIFGTDYLLSRYPRKHQRELRAWDTADLYLLKTLAPLLADIERLLIVHDRFGALAVPLATYHPISYGDSWMSQRAIELNYSANDLKNTVYFESSLEDLVSHYSPPQCIIGRIPKSLSQLSYLLQQLNRWVPKDTPLMLAGMDKHLSRNQYELLARYFGPSQFLPGVKKARIWTAKCDPQLQLNLSSISADLYSHEVESTVLDLPQYQLSLTMLPNVFSRGKLDQGSRFFLEQFQRLPQCLKVADMACGCGILGLAYLKQYPESQLIFCDESFQAVKSTKLNLAYHMPNAQVSIYADDGLKQVEPDSLELVICNPPFHQQHTVSTDIALSLFQDAYRALVLGGELWIVANRHLGYHTILKRIFGHCNTEVGNQKFVILRSRKSR